jgi:Zn-dependent alcohol dehydrogenase
VIGCGGLGKVRELTDGFGTNVVVEAVGRLPPGDFPMLIDLYLQDGLPLERFVSETIRPSGYESNASA